MSKIQPIGNGWNHEAALRDTIDRLKDDPDAELLVLHRLSNKHYANWATVNVSNKDALFLVEEFKHDIMNRCHDCKCQKRNK